ncbi:hypothetical protein AWV80_02380 [Cupriavidus sp. UYMU48A]|nr:hypothetical protein AWV80_02380 [Cupriavidus sp. UYMU48A]
MEFVERKDLGEAQVTLFEAIELRSYAMWKRQALQVPLDTRFSEKRLYASGRCFERAQLAKHLGE